LHDDRLVDHLTRSLADVWRELRLEVRAPIDADALAAAS